MSLYHDQHPLVVIRCQPDRTADRKADLELQRRFEFWLRALTDDEHRAALAKYRELQDHFPELLMREAYIAAATMIRKT